MLSFALISHKSPNALINGLDQSRASPERLAGAIFPILQRRPLFVEKRAAPAGRQVIERAVVSESSGETSGVIG